MSEVQRAVVKGTIGGVVQLRNIFTGDVTLVSPDTASDVWTGYLTDIYDHVMPFIASVTSLTSVELFRRSGSQWESFDEFAFADSGDQPTDPLPNYAAAVLIGKATGVRAVGRKFFGAIAEASTTANSLASTALISLASALAAYIGLYTSVAGSTLSPGIWTKSSTFRPFISGLVSQLLGTCRRRKPGRGI